MALHSKPPTFEWSNQMQRILFFNLFCNCTQLKYSCSLPVILTVQKPQMLLLLFHWSIKPDIKTIFIDLLGSVAAVKQTTEKSHPYRLVTVNLLANVLPPPTFSRHKATLVFIWSHVYEHQMSVSPIFLFFHLALFWSQSTSEGQIYFLLLLLCSPAYR